MGRKGFLITLEATDGIGKTTLLNNLIDHFSKEDRLYCTKEPGDHLRGSSVGQGVRSLLFARPGANKMAPGVADLLFLADHIQNSFEIQEKLNKDYLVISDRYADSQFVYSKGDSKKAPDWAMTLYREQYGVKPDLILFLKALDIETGWTLLRAQKRSGIEAGKQDAKPWNTIEEQIKIQNAYEEHFRYNPNVVTINVAASDIPQMVTSKAIQAIENTILLKEGHIGQAV
jgi:dTMP kinase